MAMRLRWTNALVQTYKYSSRPVKQAAEQIRRDQGLALVDPADRPNQLVEALALGHVPGCPGVDHLGKRGLVLLCRQDEDPATPHPFPDVTGRPDHVVGREIGVEDGHLWTRSGRLLDRLEAVPGLSHHVEAVLGRQRRGQRLPEQGVGVRQDDAHGSPAHQPERPPTWTSE
jgi:hypothetical protein